MHTMKAQISLCSYTTLLQPSLPAYIINEYYSKSLYLTAGWTRVLLFAYAPKIHLSLGCSIVSLIDNKSLNILSGYCEQLELWISKIFEIFFFYFSNKVIVASIQDGLTQMVL